MFKDWLELIFIWLGSPEITAKHDQKENLIHSNEENLLDLIRGKTETSSRNQIAHDLIGQYLNNRTNPANFSEKSGKRHKF